MSVQVSHVHGEAVGSGRVPSVVWKLEVGKRGSLGKIISFGVWAEGSQPLRGRKSGLEGVGRLGPAPEVFVVWISWSESRVRSIALLFTLSFAAFAASL